MDRNRERYECDGYCLVSGVLNEDELSWMHDTLSTLEHPCGERSRQGKSFAIRDVFAASPELLHFAQGEPLRGLASTLLANEARPTKATLFDKHPDANWSLPLHQDLTITVQARAEVPGFGPWTEKAGVPHVRPPESVLKSIVALRIHLDDCPEENGALRVVRQSHRNGRLSSNELKSIVDGLEAETVAANARDVLAMSPLILHGSGKSTQPNRRRVLHVEYSCIELPAPLEWPSWEASMITSSIND